MRRLGEWERPGATRFASTIVSLVVTLLLLQPAASASDQALIFSGGGADYAGSGFIGATLALPGSQIGTGLAIRGSAFTGAYDYESSPYGTVRANFSGGEVDALYQISGAKFWSEFAIGARDVDTRLAPFDSTNRRAGIVDELAASFDGGKVAGQWRGDWYGSYGARLADYAARLSVTHALGPIVRLGTESSIEGDPTYHLYRFGPYVGVQLDKRSEVQVSAGVSSESGRNGSGFFRVGVYRRI
jgi:hypothetical protein